MVVVDASVMVDVLVGAGRATERLKDQWVAAPHLLDAEVGHALRRKVRLGDLQPDLAVDALMDLNQFELLRYDHSDLLDRAWALRQNLSFYDALYVALAEMLEAPLLTHDIRLAAAPGVEAVVELVPMGT
jgi:predicted nucleic acid-binding protein